MRDGQIYRATARNRGNMMLVTAESQTPLNHPDIDDTLTASINAARGRVARREQLTSTALTIVCAIADLVDRIDDPDIDRDHARVLAVESQAQLAVLTKVLNEVQGS